jgi:hypothetical protein
VGGQHVYGVKQDQGIGVFLSVFNIFLCKKNVLF